MGLWDYISDILPDGLLDSSENDQTFRYDESGEGHSRTRTSGGERDEVDRVTIDFEYLSRQEQSRLINETWEDQGEFILEDSIKDKKAIERASEDDQIQSTLAYYDGKLGDRYFGMLKAALFLRRIWQGDKYELNRNEMRKRKRDIAERFGDEAHVVCNLATAGYFDEGGYIRTLFEDLELNTDVDELDYIELFEEVVNNQPFTVFVGAHEDVHLINQRIKKRIRQKQQYGVEYDFIDIRGIGDLNREKIQQVVEELYDEADEFRSETISVQPDMVERIFLDDVSGLIDD